MKEENVQVEEKIKQFFEKRKNIEKISLEHHNSKIPKEIIETKIPGGSKEEIEQMSVAFKEYCNIFKRDFIYPWVPSTLESSVAKLPGVVMQMEEISSTIPCDAAAPTLVLDEGNNTTHEFDILDEPYCKRIFLETNTRPNQYADDSRYVAIVAGFVTTHELGGTDGARYSITVNSKPLFQFPWLEAGSFNEDGYSTLSIQSHMSISINNNPIGPDVQVVVFGSSQDTASEVWGYPIANPIGDIEKEHNITTEFEKMSDSRVVVTELVSMVARVFGPVGQGGVVAYGNVFWPAISYNQRRIFETR